MTTFDDIVEKLGINIDELPEEAVELMKLGYNTYTIGVESK